MSDPRDDLLEMAVRKSLADCGLTRDDLAFLHGMQRRGRLLVERAHEARTAADQIGELEKLFSKGEQKT